MPTPNIIDQLGTSWKLDVAAIATFSYQHPTFGSLVYSGDPDVPWICDNVNTLTLTSKGTLPDGVLPEKVCIRPKFDGECGSYDLNPYNPPEDQCLCKDPGCDFTLPLFLTCDGATDNCLATFTQSESAEATCEATGPVYVGSCTLNGVDMEVRIYCAAGQWMADIYNDDVLCDSCVELTNEGCPFRITTRDQTTEVCANDCVPCIGEDCEPEEPCDPTDCDSYPDDMTVTFSGSTCLNGSTTISRTAPGSTSWASASNVGTWSISAECTGGNFTVSPIDTSTACAILPFNSVTVECDPVSMTFGTQDITDVVGCTCVGDTVTLVVSA